MSCHLSGIAAQKPPPATALVAATVATVAVAAAGHAGAVAAAGAAGFAAVAVAAGAVAGYLSGNNHGISRKARRVASEAHVPVPMGNFHFELLNNKNAAARLAFLRKSDDQASHLDDAGSSRHHLINGESSKRRPEPSGRTVIFYDLDMSTEPDRRLEEMADVTLLLISNFRDWSSVEFCFKITSFREDSRNSDALVGQFRRLRGMFNASESDEVPGCLTVCVDNYATSHGYIVACQASPGRLYAAPLATVGSPGAYSRITNMYDVLSQDSMKALVIRASQAKARLTLRGKVKEEEADIVQNALSKCHTTFQEMVTEARIVNAGEIDKVANGVPWTGRDAFRMGLVDRVLTSDMYIEERLAAGDRVLVLRRFKNKAYGGLFSGSNGSKLNVDEDFGLLAGPLSAMDNMCFNTAPLTTMFQTQIRT
eukprot:CAMPEP_0194282666 /NCGR_PEP_ID=MMETSP0169-20130528/23611_1 /TAXON_ID=218684 /ORGANISM="Corethron pennatum, Strain L29A3" /LENGTH=424 /DNA_ID=CAMNT_0039028059 /DNA_START=64 /DNA_END=1338 /DNA_ORIENTATION=+